MCIVAVDGGRPQVRGDLVDRHDPVAEVAQDRDPGLVAERLQHLEGLRRPASVASTCRLFRATCRVPIIVRMNEVWLRHVMAKTIPDVCKGAGAHVPRFGDIDGPCYVVPHHSGQSCGNHNGPQASGVDAAHGSRPQCQRARPTCASPRAAHQWRSHRCAQIEVTPSPSAIDGQSPCRTDIAAWRAILVASVLIVAACGPSWRCSAAPDRRTSAAPPSAPRRPTAPRRPAAPRPEACSPRPPRSTSSSGTLHRAGRRLLQRDRREVQRRDAERPGDGRDPGRRRVRRQARGGRRRPTSCRTSSPPGYDALPLLTENGIVTPIDDLATQAGLDAADFPEAIWNAGQWKDQRVGIPIDTHTMNFYYNKKLFTDAGLDPEKAAGHARMSSRPPSRRSRTAPTPTATRWSPAAPEPTSSSASSSRHSSIRAAASGPTRTSPKRRSTAKPASRRPPTSSTWSTTSACRRSRATPRSTPSSRARTPWSCPASGRPPATTTPSAPTSASRRSPRSSATAPGVARTTSP